MQFHIPEPRALLKAIQCLIELPDLVRMLGVFETWRLTNIDVSIDIAIEKHSTDIQRVNMIALIGRDRQQQPEAGGVHNGTVHLREIHAILLGVALSNEPSFVLDQTAISVKLL